MQKLLNMPVYSLLFIIPDDSILSAHPSTMLQIHAFTLLQVQEFAPLISQLNSRLPCGVPNTYSTEGPITSGFLAEIVNTFTWSLILIANFMIIRYVPT